MQLALILGNNKISQKEIIFKEAARMDKGKAYEFQPLEIWQYKNRRETSRIKRHEYWTKHKGNIYTWICDMAHNF